MRAADFPECVALTRWLQNELDVIETYKVALARLADEGEREGAREVMQGHEAHAAELRELLTAMGHATDGVAATAHSCTRERLAMLGLRGGHALDALLASERKRLIAYEEVLTQKGLAPLVAQLVERGVAIEREHVGRLAACRVGRAA